MARRDSIENHEVNFLLAVIITLVPPSVGHFPRDLIFVVDTSDSMDGEAIVDAMRAFTIFAAQSTDEMRIKVIAFQTHWSYWREEWTPLPDANALEDCKAWMKDLQRKDSLGALTNPTDPLIEALKAPNAAVVLISDGIFGIDLDFMEKALKGKILGTVVVGPIARDERMKALGKMGRGGCYRVSLINREEEDE